MSFTQEQIAELEMLLRYRLDTTLEGIKVHHTAKPSVIEAARRLYEKGLVTQVDGGYLTDLGRETAEHAHALLLLLAPVQELAS
ncbi:MAG: TIGR02647 family protein [Gammaproteobacteria bacterium]|nr:MAG: TIGR02647 family protein [Gammaproteobacteria bacterium]